MMANRHDVMRGSEDDLQAFVLRMAQDGLCISRTFMLFDRRYAIEQLRLAHTSADDALRELAMRIFRRLEQPQRLAPVPAGATALREPALG